jgi:outer membrane protein assembly factor BamB
MRAMDRSRASTTLVGILALVVFLPPAHAADDADALAREILDATGVQGGLVVHVGCDDGKLTAALRANDSYSVHGLDADPANVAKAREHIRSLGVYGIVAVDHLRGAKLPYVDNSVNLIVSEDLGAVPMAEVRRALCPNGVAYVKDSGAWTKTVKPRPAALDDWTHYLHSAGNNAVSHDTVVGPPRRLQWVGSPKWARHHDHMASTSAAVSAGGRLFYIFDEGPTAAIQLTPKWSVIARDAFNGTILWRRRIDEWNPHLWPLKSGPAQLPRRLVAVGNRVYVTLGINAPLTCLDAATGKTLRTYEGTAATEEILASDGVLFALVDPDLAARKKLRATFTSQNALRNYVENAAWDAPPRSIAAIEAETGKTLWTKSTPVVPMTLTADAEHVYFHDGGKIICLDRRTGKPAWASKPLPRAPKIRVWSPPTLVAYQDVVLYAGGEKIIRHKGGVDKMTALSAKTGKVLWTAEHPPSGYDSPEDLFIASGLVWTAPTTNTRNTGFFTGRDPRTGEVRSKFPADDGKHMPHHRCHRAKATDTYLLMSRTGIELVDLKAKHWDRNDWVRGSCLYGILPANGLIYTPTHSCACYILAKLNGFNALAPASSTQAIPKNVPDQGRLQRGPAYDTTIRNPQSSFAKATEDRSEIRNVADWATFRGSSARSGVTKSVVPAKLKSAWRTEVGGKLSAVVVAGGTLYVASIDTHTVHALDAVSGEKRWAYTAGGRVDSPPTIHEGRVLFGSADGWVYCLRAADGELVWRFRAAPAERRMMSFEQIESVWPVHGSVLVHKDAVYCVAGRSMFLDGGMRLVRLDAATGKKISETVLDDRHPKTGKPLDAGIKWPNLPVALPDVLSCDGRSIYMRSQAFDLAGKRRGVVAPTSAKDQTGEGAHLFSQTGFLDGTWWHRTYWMWGKTTIAGAFGWFQAGHNAPTGRIMSIDEAHVYAFGRRPKYFPRTTAIEYHLYRTSKAPKIVKQAPGNPVSRKGRPGPTRPVYRWTRDVPLLARGMVLAPKTLFIAGPPDVADQEKTLAAFADPAALAKLADQVAAHEGRKGGLLLAVTALEGETLAEYKLDSPPVFDGLAAARGRLYLAALDGTVTCFAPAR